MIHKSQLVRLPINKLKLDGNYPRLPKSIQKLASDESEIIDWMLDEATTLELMQAIGENGYFEGEQLLVVKDDDGLFKVVEGNRRLTSVKLLIDPSLATAKKNKVHQVYEEADFKFTLKDKLPCLIFENEQDIHNYLGYRHITGVQSWKSLEKARYLSRLLKNLYNKIPLNEAYRELAKRIGSRTDFVRRQVVGYMLYEEIEDQKFYQIDGLNDQSFYFHYLSGSLNKEHITAFLGVDQFSENPLKNLNKNNLNSLIHWFFEKDNKKKTRLNATSTQLTEFNQVLANDKARKAFIEEGYTLKKAHSLTEESIDQLQVVIEQAIDNLEIAETLVNDSTTIYVGFEEDLKSIRNHTTTLKHKKELLADDFL